MPPSTKQNISKAAIRRLAHDVGARLGKELYQTTLDEMHAYVAKVTEHAVRAMSFSRRKSISLNHVLFAAGICGGVPASLRELKAADLGRLNKCNPQAPSSLRKDVLWRAEISEASFAKVAKQAAKQCHAALRVTSQARRMLQLLAEYNIMKNFDKRGTLTELEEPNPMIQNMTSVFGCDLTTAASLVRIVEEICSRAPELLAMGTVKTIDERLIRTALAPSWSWAQDWVPPDAFVPGKTVKLVERILRGRATDKRVTVGASTFLAACFQRVVMESRGEVVPSGVRQAKATVRRPQSAPVEEPKKRAVAKSAAAKSAATKSAAAKSAAAPKAKPIKTLAKAEPRLRRARAEETGATAMAPVSVAPA
jgi:histone H3/H4